MKAGLWLGVMITATASMLACDDDSDRKHAGSTGAGGSSGSAGAGENTGGASTTSEGSGGSAGASENTGGASTTSAASGGSGGTAGSSSTGGGTGSGGSTTGSSTSSAGASGTAGAGGEGGNNDSGATETAMFISDSLNNAVYRFTIQENADPVLSETIDVPAATGIALANSGELFAAEYTALGTIHRFNNPLGAPQANGTISDVGASYPHALTFVDDELWMLNSAYHACTSDPQSVVRLAFDSAGQAQLMGTVDGLIGANRGLFWHAPTRQLFVSQCYAVDAIQRFQVDNAHNVTPLPAITASSNPHGMAMTPAGDLLVATAGTPVGSTSLSRFAFQSDDTALLTGSVDGNGLSTPIGMAFAPWGELFVVNQGDASISRFTFDQDDQAVPSGHVLLNAPTQAGVAGVGWVVIP